MIILNIEYIENPKIVEQKDAHLWAMNLAALRIVSSEQWQAYISAKMAWDAAKTGLRNADKVKLVAARIELADAPSGRA